MFSVTQSLFVGRFPTKQRIDELHGCNITDIVNVSDTPSQLTPDDGPFRSVSWIEMEDGTRIPTEVAITAIDAIHHRIVRPNARVYVHCMAGWNRSPTVIWLYLLACGIDKETAAQAVCSNALDAVPGHPLLIDDALVETVQSHGESNFQPHQRPTAFEID